METNENNTSSAVISCWAYSAFGLAGKTSLISVQPKLNLFFISLMILTIKRIFYCKNTISYWQPNLFSQKKPIVLFLGSVV